MKNMILNFLATRLGARLAPLIMTALAGIVAAVAAKVPWLAPYATLENCLMLVSFLIAIGMSWVNYATTSRAFKYAEPVQKFLAVLADKLGVQPPKLDAVIAGETAGVATVLHDKVVDPNGPFTPNAEARKAVPVETPRQSGAATRPGIGGNRGTRGHIVFHLLLGMALFSLCMLMACAGRIEAKKARPAGKPAVITVPKAMQYPDVTETVYVLPRNFSGSWLQEQSEIHTPEYLRPAWQRLIFSLRPWGETGSSLAKVRVDEEAANVSGSYRSGDKVSLSKMMPESYAIGIGGGLEY